MTPGEIRQAVEWACILEATAQKPGNVHPRASFADLDYLDFVRAAIACSEPLSNAFENGVGRAVFEAVRETHGGSRSNVNLGIALLLAPLCKAAVIWPSYSMTPMELRTSVELEMSVLDFVDSDFAYRAIRLAKPGGLGSVDEEDVSKPPTMKLLQAMELAADRDAIARQYVNGFEDVFDVGLPAIEKAVEEGHGWEFAVLHCHLSFMAAIPDTLIARKLGTAMAEESQRRAQAVLDADCEAAAVRDFDAWLREDGNKRNPGASADLTAAALFVAKVTGVLPKKPRIGRDPPPKRKRKK
jgi:triphosphoribosyl-dephospho-CoA synthase